MQALAVCRGSFAYAGFFSLFINLLLLVPAVYMLQVFDRVLSSGSESTLLMLTLVATFLFTVMGGLEWVRSQILVATSNRLDGLLGPRVFDSVFVETLSSGGKVTSSQPLSDLLAVRQFLTGPGLFAFLDAPWMPIYLAVMFLFHPLVGVAAVASAMVLVGLAVWNELATRGDLKEASRKSFESNHRTQRQLRSVDAIEAMGMLPRLRARWLARQQEMLALQSRASRKAGLISGASKTFRVLIQTLILGLGAWLAIRREISPGAVIAGSILLGRALAPLDVMINTWRSFIGAREAYQRLNKLLDSLPVSTAPMPLPAPKGALAIDKLVVVPPGAAAPVLRGISMSIESGSLWALVGPSAAGKTTLARALLGVLKPSSGTVRLDGAELSQWDREALGSHVGYLPQDVELLDGTVGENIARFGEVDAGRVVAAAQAAGVHEMILRLPGGYDAALTSDGMLSAGQRQRIGLARALYGEPRLIVLDEPNANLDQEGEAALAATLADLRRAGRTVVLVTHNKKLLDLVDHIALMQEGQVVTQGPRDKVLGELQRAATPPAVTVVPARRPIAVALRPSPAAGVQGRGSN